MLPQQGRPKVFVMNGAFLGPKNFKASGKRIVSLQMSADYSGSPFWPSASGLNYKSRWEHPGAVQVGGGMVETFGFGCGKAHWHIKHGLGNYTKVTPPLEPFSLSDAVSISSALPSAKFQSICDDKVGHKPWYCGVGLSTIASVDSLQFFRNHRKPARWAQLYHVGDGASIEDTGIMPLLQRGATNILLWISTQVPLGEPTGMKHPFDFCGASEDWDEMFTRHHNTTVDFQLSSLFGYPMTQPAFGMYYLYNQVFSKEDLVPILCQMQGLKNEGKPIVYKARLRVQENLWWGIKGGASADVAFCLLEQSTNFETRLPEETVDRLGGVINPKDRKGGDFASFPLFKVLMQNSPEPFALTRAQVNLLAAQVEYSMRENEAVIRELFAPRTPAPTNALTNPSTDAPLSTPNQ